MGAGTLLRLWCLRRGLPGDAPHFPALDRGRPRSPGLLQGRRQTGSLRSMRGCLPPHRQTASKADAG